MVNEVLLYLGSYNKKKKINLRINKIMEFIHQLSEY
jgi:hypothetical protein